MQQAVAWDPHERQSPSPPFSHRGHLFKLPTFTVDTKDTSGDQNCSNLELQRRCKHAAHCTDGLDMGGGCSSIWSSDLELENSRDAR
jgi:hypothetical protein